MSGEFEKLKNKDLVAENLHSKNDFDRRTNDSIQKKEDIMIEALSNSEHYISQ